MLSPLTKALARPSVPILLAILMVATVGVRPQPAQAETPSILVEISVPSQTRYNDLMSQAEALAQAAVARYFSQNAESAAVEVVVLGDRNGDIVPVLTATVSRTQWQEQSPASSWVQFYASHSFFQRHDDSATETTAGRATRTPVAATMPTTIAAIDRAFDDGQLTGAIAQDYLSYLD